MRRSWWWLPTRGRLQPPSRRRYCTVLTVLYCTVPQWGVKQHAFDTLVEDEEKDEMREQKGDAEIQLIEQSYVAGAGDYFNVALISFT